ncbi:ABC transporter substrate-binding protein [Ureibacillus sinduriensis]|uniref:Branched-chain amino acid ABC transporter substrate-binding protein n=1 Tax=Ureibacillus sinduriensis BLB-1 = JCM 15800 TaxID=1384057 RepID=A0A0A3HWI8_9BACL|nr:ABC transporter substrate-binding protein [Ureibacillus sinduriensis]KGR76769.1 branched-chain amino acid ABC transporter substrate-binding protein [Ureibacillus sinduriensis BLB-1 = JCM 15800]
MDKLLRKSFALCAVLMLLLLAACSGENAGSEGATGEQSGTLNAKIGVVSYLTGAGAAYGEAITQGLKLAQSEINEQGEVNIELVIEDSAGEAEQALSASQKLMSDDNILAIIGPTLSTEFFAVAPEADLNGITIMGTSTTAEGIPEIGDYVFRNAIPEALAIPTAMEKAVERTGAKKVAMIYGNDDVLTQSGFETMKKTAEDMGLEILTIETFQKGQSDYNAQLTKIKNTNPDLILASALYNEGAVIMDQARKMGIEVPFVGGNGFNSPQVIEIAGDAANGLIVATPWFGESEETKVVDFNKKYEAEYGELPDQFAAQAYDALYIYADALKRAGEADRELFHEALAATEDFEGLLGNFSFDEIGDVVMDVKVVEIKDGKFVEFE